MTSPELEPKLVPPGSPWFHALQFTDASARPAVTALVALRGELLDAALAQRDPTIARMRLAWWREEIQRMAAGEARHPVGQALANAAADAQLESDYLLELIDGAEMDLAGERPGSDSELTLYLHRSSGVLHELIAQVCGLNDAAAERDVRRYAQRLGQGLRLVEIGRDLIADARSGRYYVPGAWLETHGVGLTDLERGESTENLSALTRSIGRQAAEILDEACMKLPARERPRQRTGLVLLALYRRILARLERPGAPLNTASEPLGISSLFQAWNAARRAQKGLI